MEERYFTVEQIAQLLNIHPKTIQRYIREGRLRASKIGKSWRVTGHDLSRFTVENNNLPTEKRLDDPDERCKASTVIDIKVYDRDEADRIVNSLTAAMNVKPAEYGKTSMTAQYLDMDSTVRIALWGNIRFMSAVLSMLEMFLGQQGVQENE